MLVLLQELEPVGITVPRQVSSIYMLVFIYKEEMYETRSF